MEPGFSITPLLLLFALRILVPIAVIVLLVYALRRLDKRWEDEARMSIKRDTGVPARPAVTPALRRGIADRAGPQLPFDPARLVPLTAGSEKPCWEVKGCSDAARQKCLAAKSPDAPCWQAFMAAEGNIPERCVDCQVFQSYSST